MKNIIFSNELSLYKVLFIILFAASFIIFNGCKKNDYSSNPTGGTPSANEIFIQNFAFSSGTRTISAGTTLKWTNKDGVTHTVTSGVPGSPSGVFNSGNVAPGSSFSYTFNQTGEYKYYCMIHTYMNGTITVQ